MDPNCQIRPSQLPELKPQLILTTRSTDLHMPLRRGQDDESRIEALDLSMQKTKKDSLDSRPTEIKYG